MQKMQLQTNSFKMSKELGNILGTCRRMREQVLKGQSCNERFLVQFPQMAFQVLNVVQALRG